MRQLGKSEQSSALSLPCHEGGMEAQSDAGNSLTCRIRSCVPIPLSSGYCAQFITFHGLSDQNEHFCIAYKGWEKSNRPLVRVHSECLTGDMFGSLRCDCGPQLAEAQSAMAEKGGLIVYLRQEGRGIGLYNKLDSYELQAKGLDTFAANVALGFGEDERSYCAAYEMLNCLGVRSIQLMTNNPAKVAQIRGQGMDVAQVSTGHYENAHNAQYLAAKVEANKATRTIC